MLAVAVAAAGFAVPLWAQEQLPPPDAPPNALRSTGTTYQQINNATPDGNNPGSPPVWNVSPVSRGGAGPSLGANQQSYGLQPNSASNQPFWGNQSGTVNSTPKYQYTPPEQPRFGMRLRKLFGGSPAPTSPTTTPTPASLPPSTAMTPSGSMIAPTASSNNIGLPSAKPIKPAVSNTGAVMTASAPAAVLTAPRIMQAGARPDWGWQGYDNFNQLSPISRQPIVQADSRSSNANSNPDMGPYMKYAHLWRPSNGSAAITNPALAQQRPSATPAADEGFSVAKEPAPNGSSSATHGPIHTLPLAEQDGPILNPESEPAHLQPANYGSAVTEPAHHRAESTQPMDSLTVWPVANHAPEAQPNARPAASSSPPHVQPAPINPPPPAPTGSGLPLTVREKIGEVCKVKARNLVVEQISPLHLRVGFMCKTQADADGVTNHLAGLRELAPYNLDYEIQIGQ